MAKEVKKAGFKIIDSHAHLNFKAFDRDRDHVLDEALNAGMGIINVGAGFDTSRKAVEMAQGHSRGVYAAIGIHPIHVLDEDYSQEAMYDLFSNNEHVVAIGEVGLDYFHTQKTKDKQQKLLFQQLELARLLKLPVIFHCRGREEYDAHHDLLRVLEKFAETYNDFELKGVMHCFTGDITLAKAYLSLGIHLGFTGAITFGDNYDKVVEDMPLDRILIETDCPYLAPVPMRGKRNEPRFVKYVAEKIAKIKGEEEKTVIAQTVKNAVNLFGLGR